MTLSIVIPAYNEQATIAEIIRRVFAVDLNLEVIVVDDCSTDGTDEILRALARERDQRTFKVVRHERNRGKGAAIQTGLAQVTGDCVIIQDADLEYDPAEYPKLLQPLLDNKADVVFGSRFLGGPHRVHLFWHYVGNQFLTFLTNVLYNICLTDMEVGYKVFKTEVIKGLHIHSNGFGFEPEVTAKVAKKKYRLYEVPISYYGRGYEEGKKITWRDGVIAVWTLLRYRVIS